MLQVPEPDRSALWDALIRRIEQYHRDIPGLRVAPVLDLDGIRSWLCSKQFERAEDPVRALKDTADALTRWQVHTPHPRYFGLFNPRATTAGIAADALAAAFNPQMAAWSHSPFAAEVEAHLVRAFGGKFGYDPSRTDGTFCSGGMEANHTAVLAALTNAFPKFLENGLASLRRPPVFYVSAESHHSFLKAARMCGLGAASVRHVAVDSALRLRPAELRTAIRQDRAGGFAPFLVAGTAGTTNAGAIDPLPAMADVAAEEKLWFHVDAAWGGAAAIVPELRPLINGIERADSITFDAHKWLSVPMGAGLFLTNHRTILERTFRVATAYMPKEAAKLDVVDPHVHSMQWSRRFIGLKVFLSLLVAGWGGYAEAIRHQTEMGNLLAERLRQAGWEIVAASPLAVVCFAEGQDAAVQTRIASEVVSSGAAWISTTVVGPEHRTVLRACITNYLTGPGDIDALVEALGSARRS